MKKGNYFIDSANSIDLKGNRISGFPDFLGSAGISFNYQGLSIQLTGKYVGELYSDNYDNKLKEYLALYPGFTDYSDNLNDAYFAADLSASYKMNLFSDIYSFKDYLCRYLILQIHFIQHMPLGKSFSLLLNSI